jgi:hypothetical protein
VAVEIISFVNAGLGRSSCMVDLGDGAAPVVDPARLPTARLAQNAARATAGHDPAIGP